MRITSSIRRKSGIPLIGDIPWGSHFCQLYETEKDLLDIVAPYVRAGLENNELCVWITSKPVDSENAVAAMEKATAHFRNYVKKGQVEIIPYSRWCAMDGKSGKAIISRLDHAIARGFAGFRFACSAPSETRGNTILNSFRRLDVLSTYNMIALFACWMTGARNISRT